MNENIENEERVMINVDQYNLLKSDYISLPNATQYSLINYYFDDKNLSLKKSHRTLRIRSINDNEYELTLKIKGDNGDKEINIPLSKNEVIDIINSKSLDNPIINKELNDIKHNEIIYITSLKTDRIEVKYNTHLLVIDKNEYSDVIDYDIEVESNNKKEALRFIIEYCDKYHLTYSSHYIGKSHRAINQALKR